MTQTWEHVITECCDFQQSWGWHFKQHDPLSSLSASLSCSASWTRDKRRIHTVVWCLAGNCNFSQCPGDLLEALSFLVESLHRTVGKAKTMPIFEFLTNTTKKNQTREEKWLKTRCCLHISHQEKELLANCNFAALHAEKRRIFLKRKKTQWSAQISKLTRQFF